MQRNCGCKLEKYGWKTHLHTIRSRGKLTAGGMAFLDLDMIRLLDEVLPTKFGGTPTDYQIIESEDRGGNPLLTLVVHPSVGPVPDRMLVETFLGALRMESEAARLVTLLWRQGNLVNVERRPPSSTSSGKILHLHVENSNKPSGK